MSTAGRPTPGLICGVVALAMMALLWARPAHADDIDVQVSQLRGGGAYKPRLAAALALARSPDGRAIQALAQAVERDSDASIRRVAAIALGRQVNAATADDVRRRAIEALDHAARDDKDAKVREAAAAALAAVSSAPPPVFVNVGPASDTSRKAPEDAARKLERAVKSAVRRSAPGYATEWPGGLPSSTQLTQAGSQAFYVAPTVAVVDIARKAARGEVACTVTIRVAPWTGKDGAERWQDSKVASASGSGKAITGASDADIAGGIRDCIAAVGEELTARQVVPFIKKLATP